MYIIIYAQFPFRINSHLLAFYCALPHAVNEHLQHISDPQCALIHHIMPICILIKMANFTTKTNRKPSQITSTGQITMLNRVRLPQCWNDFVRKTEMIVVVEMGFYSNLLLQYAMQCNVMQSVYAKIISLAKGAEN